MELCKRKQSNLIVKNVFIKFKVYCINPFIVQRYQHLHNHTSKTNLETTSCAINSANIFTYSEELRLNIYTKRSPFKQSKSYYRFTNHFPINHYKFGVLLISLLTTIFYRNTYYLFSVTLRQIPLRTVIAINHMTSFFKCPTKD